MRTRLFLLFNHQLTPQQASDAVSSLDVRDIVTPPEDLQVLWSQVPAEAPGLEPFVAPFKDWLKALARPGDHVLIQGDYGATYLMVRFAMEQGLVPVYATTRRRALEEQWPDGSIRLTHHFAHQRFRKYGV